MCSTSNICNKPSKAVKLSSVESRPGPSLRRRGLLASMAIITLLSGFTGCSTVHNGYVAMTNSGAWNETVMVLRNRSFSAKAWHRRKHHFCDQKYSADFCAGFRAGYESVASGSDGCTPAFPPKEYWSWEYQSGEGQARTAAWFSGYPHGCRAAEEDGVNNWSQLQMSSGYQAQYQQTGMFDHQGALYPIPADDTGYTGAPHLAPTDLPPGAILVPENSVPLGAPLPTHPGVTEMP